MSRITLPRSDERLLKQCEVSSFRASGRGGQHLHKTESAVRLLHRPTGIVVTSQQERSQHRNKAICIEKLRARVAKLNYRRARRIPTRMPTSIKRKIRESKIRRSAKKKLRSRPEVQHD